MSRKSILTSLFVFALVTASFGRAAVAQYDEVVPMPGDAPTERAVMPYVMPPGGSPGVGSRPRLGFMGTMIYGYGMRVDHVTFGMPAQRAGLESGDVIWSIEGRRILSRRDYDEALWHAAIHHGGWVHMIVKNIRFDMGLSHQQFVSVSVRAIGGPVAYYAPGGVPVEGGIFAYSAEGSESAHVEGHDDGSVHGGIPYVTGGEATVEDGVVEDVPHSGGSESGDF